MRATRIQIEEHLATQYDAWAAVIYPHGRREAPASLTVKYNDHASGYSCDRDEIILYIPCGNESDFDNRINLVTTAPNKLRLTIAELELLHEMMHERQYKEQPIITTEGQELYNKFSNRFLGPGHDATFCTALAISAPLLGVNPEQLVRILCLI